MKRFIPLSAALASVLALSAGCAHAQGFRDRDDRASYTHSRDYGSERHDRDGDRDDRDARRDRARAYRDLQDERARFYASRDRDLHARAEFERWYADQCARLGYAR